MIDSIETYSLLMLLFLSVAYLHSSVGLGGGSSYTALMVLFGVAVPLIPVIALSLNILVSSIGIVQFSRKGLMPWKTLIPLLLVSIPAAYVGGALTISSDMIMLLLAFSLLMAATRFFYFDHLDIQIKMTTKAQRLLLLLLGCGLGVLSGAVGIGGGIYLVPALVILGILDIKRAAACGSVFIFCNSCAGLVAKYQHADLPITLILPLALIVCIGGIFGSSFSIKQVSLSILQKTLATVMCLASALLFVRVLIS